MIGSGRCLLNENRNARKPVFSVSDKAKHKLVFSATETSKKIEISLEVSLDVILSKKRITNALISLRVAAMVECFDEYFINLCHLIAINTLTLTRSLELYPRVLTSQSRSGERECMQNMFKPYILILGIPRNCMSLAVPRNGTDKSIVMVKVKDTYGRPEGLWEVEVTYVLG